MIKEIDGSLLSSFCEKSSNPFVKYLGYIDGVIIGYIEYNDIYDTIDIVNVFVLKEYRNKGIGYALMSELISVSKTDLKKNITLEVNSLNFSAISLYQKCGFKKVGIRSGYYKGVDGYLMELIL